MNHSIFLASTYVVDFSVLNLVATRPAHLYTLHLEKRPRGSLSFPSSFALAALQLQMGSPQYSHSVVHVSFNSSNMRL